MKRNDGIATAAFFLGVMFVGLVLIGSVRLRMPPGTWRTIQWSVTTAFLIFTALVLFRHLREEHRLRTAASRRRVR